MNKILLFLLILITFPLFSQDKNIEALFEKYSKFYETYQGIISVRKIEAISISPEDKKVLKKFSVEIKRKDFFYKTPEIVALKYFENGKEVAVSDYDTREIEPFFPLFDKNGKENYNFSVTGEEVADGKKCVKIEVKPKKISARHFKGEILVDSNSNELVVIRGEPAELHWAMKQFKVEFHFKDLNGFPVLNYGTVTARVKVFLIISDNITTYKLKAVSNSFF